MLRCDNVLDVVIPPCKTILFLDAGLDASTAYVLHITDKFNQPYINTITTQPNGNLKIETGDPCILKADLFNPHAYSFLLELFLADGTTPKLLAMCDEVFDAISLKVEGEASGSDTFQIACP